MKNILVLSFMHEDPLVLKEFELLRKHYNKIINYFGFPIKYYGVRATENEKSKIDEENQIIWLHTDNIEEYDKKLVAKVVDCFNFIEKSGLEYDILIKGNTSTYLNLIILNELLQNGESDVIYTGIITYIPNNPTISYFGRGNCVCLSKNHINIIINLDVKEIINKMINDMPHQEKDIWCIDDVMISYMLPHVKMYQVSMLTFGYFYNVNVINDIRDILRVATVCYKIYNIEYIGEDLNMNPSIIILNLIINFVETNYIFEIMHTCTSIEYQY